MLRRKFEYVWKFLRENDCHIAADNITNGMRCTICGKVMINAHIGGCGCRYCLGCVTDHLNGDSRFCPGNGDDCKQELLVIDENVLPDPSMNQEILKLIVKCPREWCQFTCALGRMEEHALMCEKHEEKCPFCDIGCSELTLAKAEVKEHLCDENESHAILLMQFIGNLRNENKLIKKKVLDLESVIETTRTAAADPQISELRALVLTQAAEIEQLQVRGQTQAEEIAHLWEKCLQLESKFGWLERHNRKREADWDRDIGEVRVKQARCDDAAVRVREKWVKVKNGHRGEFVWCIDRWSTRRQAARNDKRKQWIFSDAFYLQEQGYRMCLSVWPDGFDGNDDLDIKWRLMRGPFDEHLPWPFRGDVTLSVVDQETRLDHASFTIRHDQYPDDAGWEKPTSEINSGFYNDGITINVEELSRNPALCRDDRILIRCVVTMRE